MDRSTQELLAGLTSASPKKLVGASAPVIYTLCSAHAFPSPPGMQCPNWFSRAWNNKFAIKNGAIVCTQPPVPCPVKTIFQKGHHPLSMIQPTDQYKVLWYSTIPRSYRISKDHLCYLPVSLETKPFQQPILDVVVEWISKHFNKCAVLVGDSVHRLTLQVTRNLSPQDAIDEALRLGEAFIGESQAVFNAHMPGKFEFFKCSDIKRKRPECAAYQESLSRMVENNEDFMASVTQSAAAYVDRRFKGNNLAGITLTRDEVMALAQKYLVEEMALFATIAGMGWTVDVYPGKELPTLIEIAKGKYPGVPEPLTERKNIALKLGTKPVAEAARPAGQSAASASA